MNGKRGNNIYIGSWTETPCEQINWPFTYGNLKSLVTSDMNDSQAPYTHQQIVDWCYRFWQEFLDEDVIDANLVKALEVSGDIDAQ